MFWYSFLLSSKNREQKQEKNCSSHLPGTITFINVYYIKQRMAVIHTTAIPYYHYPNTTLNKPCLVITHSYVCTIH